jgi:ATP-dependent RNA helicase RhlE
VSQRVHPVDQNRKRELLAHLVSAGNWQQVLVFTRTKHGANRLAQQLTRDGVEADAIHGNKSQNHRTRVLKDFKDGRVRVLVATDIAARGLDIIELPHVVNFDLPHVPEDYVHRIGRTGRAGCEGEAISLVSAEEHPLLHAIERLIKRHIARSIVPGFEPGRAAPPPASAQPAPRAAQHRPKGKPARPQRHAPGRGQEAQERRLSPPPPPAPAQAPRRHGRGPTPALLGGGARRGS